MQFFIFFMRTKEFNLKVILKVANFVFRFLRKKFLEFCEASKSYTSALYDKTLLTVVKCLCGKTCVMLHSFFPHPFLCLVTKMDLLNRLLSS